MALHTFNGCNAASGTTQTGHAGGLNCNSTDGSGCIVVSVVVPFSSGPRCLTYIRDRLRPLKIVSVLASRPEVVAYGLLSLTQLAFCKSRRRVLQCRLTYMFTLASGSGMYES